MQGQPAIDERLLGQWQLPEALTAANHTCGSGSCITQVPLSVSATSQWGRCAQMGWVGEGEGQQAGGHSRFEVETPCTQRWLMGAGK